VISETKEEIMAATSSGSRGKSATVTINPHQQNLEMVNRIVAEVLNMAGCGHCGRLALLRTDFLGDPPEVLGKAGVISVQTEGF
jgi:hypothetical protein